ncbi:UDP-N-acetylmuramoyl-L-alanine--D-glutamate ligase [Nisaea acidiphila]|uniref:UDP-N-acetylmuramoylalanine--D-glutamate ligase n=1 Tax=Nisaea acidiphila TaxID=1862145 RepID=A0A9J7AUL3_9PROT|nr:UDP-N-acetylmuramoyl-L-alanine--D-glutamate ligase [Nisaea acidiphila]UUX49093.1 UDP-N-acetylmuramoyl-L-alanine--D-glutamate ligase [Nisaea acidiphila]
MIPCHSKSGKRIFVMGLGLSGLATVEALVEGGAHVTAWDDRAERRASAGRRDAIVAAPESVDWAEFDYLVLSPGIPHTHPEPHPAAAAAEEAGVPIIGDVELLLAECPDANIVAITGTNGKSTTTALIGHIFETAGKRSQVGGNLGTPVLSFEPLGADGTYILELSSYQLELTPSLAPEIAILLNISPDHLDRHGGLKGYIEAKTRIFAKQGAEDTAIVGIDDADAAAIADKLETQAPKLIRISGKDNAAADLRYSGSSLVACGNPVLSLVPAKTLPGDHNHQNAAAAFAACRAAGVDAAVIAEAMFSFPGLAHRQELVTERDGIRYVNDSKATNADASERALGCYEPIYWIAGGRAKEGGITPLKPYFARIRHAFLIGESAKSFGETLGKAVPHSECGTLDKAVDAAHSLAKKEHLPGATLLLSPAAASFDQFDSFEQRGDRFRDQVLRLTEIDDSGEARS